MTRAEPGRMEDWHGALARRARRVAFAKRALPLVALALLALLVLWPRLTRGPGTSRLAYRHGPAAAEGTLLGGHYTGLDRAGRAFTITAAAAADRGDGLVRLVRPAGDIMLTTSGPWLFARADRGTLARQTGQLDLVGGVFVYRNDGTWLATHGVTLDMHDGIASSTARVHAEGPFGTLDAQGFTIAGAGALLRFSGPVRLVLNGAALGGVPAGTAVSGIATP